MRYNTDGWNALLAMLSTGAILGHNLWLLASRKGESRLRLEMNTSDLFPLSESAISPERIAALSLISSRGSLPVKEFSIEGTSLVAEVDAPESGMLLVVLTLHPREITLSAEKFEHYLAEEDARDAIAIRRQTGQTSVDGREIYTSSCCRAETCEPLGLAERLPCISGGMGQAISLLPRTGGPPLTASSQNASQRPQ